MKEVYCDYCGRRAEFVDSKVIYGKSYGMIYLCRCCPGYAYVGVHKGTDRPLGRLADMELRELKKLAHAAFDPLWKEGRFKGHRRPPMLGCPSRWACPRRKPTSVCLTRCGVNGSFRSAKRKGVANAEQCHYHGPSHP